MTQFYKTSNEMGGSFTVSVVENLGNDKFEVRVHSKDFFDGKRLTRSWSELTPTSWNGDTARSRVGGTVGT